jgi:uncharacterized Zn finger protein (UPF0148 family)
MSKSMFDSHQVDLPCPKCKYKISANLGDLRTSPQLICPACGVTFTVDASGFNKGADEVEKALDDMKRKLRNAFK